ncbi:MAG: hypothetical protein IKF79_05550 [Methanosphaera sp.]|nr:hypothetical protein [Methanosphaera sp.]
MVNILTGFEKINVIINECINREICTDGLLEDVETFINTYFNEGQVEEPVIWLTQHPSTVERNADISKTALLKTPFEFDCGVYDTEIEDANTASQNLTNRVIVSILKNWQTIQSTELPGQRMIRNIELETYSPMGYVPVTGKSDKVPVTGVILNVYHVINWQQCCQQINQSNGD